MKRPPWVKSYAQVAGVERIKQARLPKKKKEKQQRRTSTPPAVLLDRWYVDVCCMGKLCVEGLDQGRHWDGLDAASVEWLSVDAIRMLVARDSGKVVSISSIGGWALDRKFEVKTARYKVELRRRGGRHEKTSRMYRLRPLVNEEIAQGPIVW